jgi:hypothetical protein
MSQKWYTRVLVAAPRCSALFLMKKPSESCKKARIALA